MSPRRPFRFSLQAFDASSAADWVSTCRRAEDLGYDTLFTTDHYFGPGEIVAASGPPGPVSNANAPTATPATTSNPMPHFNIRRIVFPHTYSRCCHSNPARHA